MPYLDHAGAGQPSTELLEDVTNLMKEVQLANPHSWHSTSRRTKQMVDNARQRILQYFNTSSDNYVVIFTSNTTHSLKLVAESFVFGKKRSESCEISTLCSTEGPQYAYLRDSHNSVIGMREIVKDKVDLIVCLDYNSLHAELPTVTDSLFTLTAMSNFCGRKYDLSIVQKLQNKGWSVCLDAASLVCSSSLDLSLIQPNFVALSFYKMFGYPTGLGALLICKDSESRLTKSYFAGGTVAAVVPDKFVSVHKKKIEERFEYGTINYYAITSLQKGFDDFLRYGGIKTIQDKTYFIAYEAFRLLRSKYHKNGNPVVEIYNQNPTHFEKSDQQGPIITFNIKREDGSLIGYSEVEKMAELFGIDLRTGCFCNVGACQTYLGLTSEDLEQNQVSGKECGDEMDMINGKPTGAVRISFGRQSKIEDITALEQMIECCFMGQTSPINIEHPISVEHYHPTISRLICYPVKSCKGIDIESSVLTVTGLMYDRHFMIVNNDIVLSQKKYPELCGIRTELNSSSDTLKLISTVYSSAVEVAMKQGHNCGQQSIVCANSVPTFDCGPTVSSWLDSILGMSGCHLRRITTDSCRSLSNESPYLLVNESSIRMIADPIALPLDDAITRFRPNIVLRGLPPFIEDSATELTIDGIKFEIIGKCTRCEMICINQETGQKEPALIVSLRNVRNREKMTFGIYIRQNPYTWAKIGLKSRIQFK